MRVIRFYKGTESLIKTKEVTLMLQQLPEIAQFMAVHPVFFSQAVANACTETLVEGKRDTGEILVLHMMGT